MMAQASIVKRAVIVGVLLLLAGTAPGSPTVTTAAAHGHGGRGGGGWHGGHGHDHGHTRFFVGGEIFLGGPLFYDPFVYPYRVPYPYAYYVPYPYPYYVPNPAGSYGKPPEQPAAPAATYGLVQLRGVPNGAAVDLDGRFWLYAQALDQRWLAVPRGEHTITVQMQGASPIQRTFEIEDGSTLVLDFGVS